MTVDHLQAEIEELRLRLEEAEETIRAIRTGDVDAFVVERPDGHQIYTLETADKPYRLFVEEMQQGAATLHTDGTIAWCNRRLADLLKEPHERLVGAALCDFISPEDRPLYENLLWQGQNRAGRGEAKLQRADGGRVPAYLTFNALPADCGAAIGVLITDLTAQRHHEQLTAAHTALLDSEERYRLLFDSSPHATFVFDAETLQFLAANDAALKLYGYSPQEFLSLGLLDIRPAQDQPAAHEILAHLPQSGRVTEVRKELGLSSTHRHRSKDGRILFVEPSIQQIRYCGRLAWLTTIADITERTQMEDALRKSAAELSDADRRKDEFLATLAHELRNPLAPVRNAVQILHTSGPLVPEVEWARDIIDRQMQQMTRLIDDLMDVSRITRNKLELRAERVALATIVNSALETSRSLIEKCGHELTVTLPPEPIYLQADLTRLSQVFLNLLNNAAKYTEKGGRIDLRAARHGNEIVVSVKDTGIGISSDKLDGIFEMFNQVDRSLERSQGGLGIGLTLVKRLVELHGGSVEARSGGAGQGSEFVVRLPLASSDPGGDSALTAESRPPAAARRILIVDDNRDAAKTLAMLLKLSGHQTQTAFDGLDAVAAAAEFRPEVVLLDIGLPKLNGYEVCRRIREQPWGARLLLVALTGWGQEDDRRKSREAGFDSHMVKPVDLPTLNKLLAEALEPAIEDRPSRH